ncbi:hypothetical protein EPO05_04860 [Patescibacteria group bacterium]|nr:MAG: hypothetical protein EPO05_04860 [Patescibacteria group bacterium]
MKTKTIVMLFAVLALAMVATPAMAGEFYVVLMGDNPETVAKKLGVTVSYVMSEAGISDPRQLKIGTRIDRPSKQEQVAQTAPAPVEDGIQRSGDLQLRSRNGMQATPMASTTFQAGPSAGGAVMASPALTVPDEVHRGGGGSDVELTAALGYWWSNLASGLWADGEVIPWRPLAPEKQWGVGAFAAYEKGETKHTTYSWDAPEGGLQLGYNYGGVSESSKKPQAFTAKLRVVYEAQKGRNDEGYSRKQDNIKVGLWTDYAQRLSKDWLVGVQVDAWTAVWSKLDSTWKDDKTDSRTQASLDLYGQYRLANNWQTRFGGQLFYQGWDDLTGVLGRAEIRLSETVRAGGWVSYPLNLPDNYKGHSKSDLMVKGVFVGVEF